MVVLELFFLGACSYFPKPNESCTASSGASGSRCPLWFRRALSKMSFVSHMVQKTHLKNVYERTTSSTCLHAGSSSMSLSMKNSNGMSTSSPANSFCSSKQKHSTLEKYGAICGISESYFSASKNRETWAETHSVWSHIIRSNSNNILIRIVLRTVKRQT